MEKHISRSGYSGSLDRLRKVEVGAHETFSNIKNSAQNALRPEKLSQKTNSSSATGRQNINLYQRFNRIFLQPRVLMHSAVAGFVAVPVLASQIGEAPRPELLGMVQDRGGYGSVLDLTAAQTVAASVAEKSDLLVTKEAVETATTLNSQIDLATSDDGTLAKRQVVETAGNATRGMQTYVVQAGDTLSDIAGKHNVTTDTVKWANNLDEDDLLKTGQKLVILPVSGVLHTAVEGDTAESLAGKYQANAAQLISYNNLEVKSIEPGMKLIIPDGIKPEPPKPKPVQARQTQVASAAAAPAKQSAPVVKRYAGSFKNTYAYGYCTYYVAGRRAVPPYWGDARNWYYNAQASGFAVGSAPAVGAIAWTSAGYYGHVAFVESVNGNMVTVSEMNYNGNWNRVTSRTVSASSFRYIY